jgi:hypothetical protein
LVWLPGLLSCTAPAGLTAQLKVATAVLVLSVAVTVTVYGEPAASPVVTVPVIRPLLELIDRPAGRPVAE